MGKAPYLAHRKDWRRRLHETIFEADTPAGKVFDVVLLWLIVACVVVVMLGSVAGIQERYHACLPW